MALNSFLEGVARAESRNLGGRDPHLLSGPRVDTLPSLALLDVKLAEARNLDLVSSFKCFRYSPHKGLQVPLRFTLRRTGLLGHLLGQLRLVHVAFAPFLSLDGSSLG